MDWQQLLLFQFFPRKRCQPPLQCLNGNYNRDMEGDPYNTILSNKIKYCQFYQFLIFKGFAPLNISLLPSLSLLTLHSFIHLQVMMMMMMNCFCNRVDRQKVFSLISSQGLCQRSSPLRISDMPQAGLEPVQNLHSGFVE